MVVDGMSGGMTIIDHRFKLWRSKFMADGKNQSTNDYDNISLRVA